MLWRCRSAEGKENVCQLEESGWDVGFVCPSETTYSGPGRPDTVEHIGSEGYGHDEVLGVADAHYIAGFILREPGRARIDTRYRIA